jgi:hypothetical protein
MSGCCAPLGQSDGCCSPLGGPALNLDTTTLNIRTIAGPTTSFPEPAAPYWAPDGTPNAALVEAWGAGGGASAAVGGGGGAYAAETKALLGGLAVTGMSGLRTAVDTNGADVNIGGVIAQGGRSGTNGGTGGLASASTGAVKFDGGTAGDAGSSGGGAGGTSGAGGLITPGFDGGFGGEGLLSAAFGPHFPGGGGQKFDATTRRGATGGGRVSYYRPRNPGRPALVSATWFRAIPAGGTFALPQGQAGDFLVFFLNSLTTVSPTIVLTGIVAVNVQVYTLVATGAGPATAQIAGQPATVIVWRFRHATGVGSATSVTGGPAPIPNPVGALSTQYTVQPPALAGGPGYGVALSWQRHTGTTPDFQPMTELVAAPSGYNNVVHIPGTGMGGNSSLQQSSFAFDYVEANFQSPGPYVFQGASVGVLNPNNAVGVATLLIT